MAKSAKPKTLPPLTAASREIMTHMINRIAFKDYGRCCNIESIGIALAKSQKRLRTTFNKLAEQGWVTMEGRNKDKVFPTVAALQWQDRTLSEGKARAILKRAKH